MAMTAIHAVPANTGGGGSSNGGLWTPPAGFKSARTSTAGMVVGSIPIGTGSSNGCTADSKRDASGPLGSGKHPADYVRIRTLGTGTFARVCLVRRAHPRDDAEAQQVFALKMLRKTAVIKLKQIDHVRHERQILQDVAGHPFITTLQASFSDHDFLYLLLDYVPGGELFSYLRKFRRFDEATARFYAAEIVLVLEYLHEQQDGVAYRDLKPENLLLDAAGHVKLVDFGFAKRLGGGRLHQQKKQAAASGDVPMEDAIATADPAIETYTLCGTPEYIAPEVIQNMGHTTAVDWWALGILVYEFLTGYPPFWHQNPLEIYRQILEKPVVFPHDPVISPAAQDIVRQLCTVDRSLRLGNISGGAAQVRAHPFFAGVDWDALYERRQEGPIQPRVRFNGDAQCFDIYPENDVDFEPYTDDMAAQYDKFFIDF
ncbi:cyclic-AMP-dependent protein kinase catalytic [Grosmannia clavigera kw1407]|uniref:cAMP-dependent protein kinase n=1 Tax=Grosmannia clavigera (strain kw1407 / UAMH 11150) TaxID=655863 RepID=F0XJ51_GROCL|nr:cyclic-AMP-dependent protein kinase catalytic [Grosmannia clavigera kw1407]EFX02128.1 cyclic-AMP-dependent protein kinase catalytic [Grosmannia clavigera kw1407]